MNKTTRSTKSEKWRHTCNSAEIAWTNEQKVAVTSYGRNKNHDDEIKKTKRRPIIAPAIAVRLLIKKIRSNKNIDYRECEKWHPASNCSENSKTTQERISKTTQERDVKGNNNEVREVKENIACRLPE